MDLATFRKSRGLSQTECAKELGLSASSKSWISDIEKQARGKAGGRDASLKLALKIERWSEGRVTAASVCKLVVEVATQGRAA